jgi:hypothetical protein
VSEDKEVTIRIVGKNLTGEEFQKARESLVGLKKQTDETGKSGETFGQKLLGAKSATALFDDQTKRLIAGFTIASLIEKAAGAVVDWTAKTYENASALVKQSSATGVSIDTLTKWAIVARKADIDQAAFAAGAFKLGVAMEQGSSDTKNALDSIGLSYDDLKSKRPEDQFDIVLRALGKTTDEGKRNAAGVAILGLAYKEISPAVSSYGSEMDKARGMTAAQTIALHQQQEAMEQVGSFISGRFSSSLGDLAVTMKTLNEDGFGVVLKALWESKGKSEEYLAAVARMRAATHDLTEGEKDQVKGLVEKGLKLEEITKLYRSDVSESIAEYAKTLGTTKAAQVNYIEQLRLQREAIRSLTAEDRQQIDAAIKGGATNDEIAKQYPKLAGAVALYKDQLSDSRKKLDEMAAAEKALQQAHQARVAEMTGATLQKAIAAESAAFVESTRVKQLNAYQTDELMKKINTFIEQSGAVTPELGQFYLAHLKWNLGIDASAESLQKLIDKLPNASKSLKDFIAPLQTGNIQSGLNGLPGFDSQLAATIKKQSEDAAYAATHAFQLAFQRGIAVAVDAAASSSDIHSAVGRLGSGIADELGRTLSGEGAGPISESIGHALRLAAKQPSLTASIASLAGSLAADLGKNIGAALGGPVGAAIGEALGSLVGPLVNKIFAGNDTKKARESFAQDMGLSLDGLYQKLQSLGSEGQRLANQALNVIGKHDEPANRAWMNEVKTFFSDQERKQQDLADAATKAAETQKSAIDSVTDKIRGQLTELDQRRQSLMDSISNEAPEEVMGIVEAQTRAQIASIDAQKASLQEQIDNVQGAGESAIDSIAHTAQETYKEIARQWQAGLVIPYTFQAQNSPDPSVSGIPHYASGGIAEGRQVAVIAERGRREIVGDVAFMTDALSGAINRLGVSGVGGGRGGDKFLIFDGSTGSGGYEVSDSQFVDRYNRLMAAKQLRVTLDSLVERMG